MSEQISGAILFVISAKFIISANFKILLAAHDVKFTHGCDASKREA